MNKTISAFIVLALLYAIELTAQIPPYINYQAVLRNTQTGEELSNQEVFIVSKFISGGPDGEIVYQEEHHEVTTSLLGLINLQLGDGDRVQGNFNSIPWANGDIWLSIEIDAGEGLKPLGTTKFSSVPYALYAASGPDAEPNLDNDPTNELQYLTLSENTLTISDNPNATPINLGMYENVPNLDNDPTNEIQDLTLTGNILKISDNPDATPIDLGILLNPSGAIQDLIRTGNSLKISDNPNATPIDLGMYENVPNLDNDPTNELQYLTLLENSLTISDNPYAIPIDLGMYENVPNLDNDPTNEIQDLNLSENILKITNNLSATEINLSEYENQALPKGHIFVGNETGVATPLAVLGDVELTDAGTTYVKSLRNIPISTTPPTDGQRLTYNAGTHMWEPIDGSNVSGAVKYYSIDPMDFVELNNPSTWATLDRHNGLKFFNENAPYAMLRSTPIRKIGAPVHLPHGATITEIKFFIKDSSPGNMEFTLQRKELANYSVENSIIVSGTSTSINGKATITIGLNSSNVVNFNNVVNNEDYTYRVFAKFNTAEYSDSNTNPQDIDQVVYGVVITYTE